MPVRDARSAFEHVSFVNGLDRLACFLVVAGAFRFKQDLTAGMDMPIQFCAENPESPFRIEPRN